MPHDAPLISTIVVALGLAWVFGALANRFKLPPLVGYLLAGIVIGPFTPGFVADQNLANQLAELGVILLMFGVGLHFSLEDLLSVSAIAIPGAIAQIACATLLGMGLAYVDGLVVGRGLRLRTGAVGGEHRGPAARFAGTQADRDRTRTHRGRLADRRGHRHGADPRAAAGHRPSCCRRGRGAHEFRMPSAPRSVSRSPRSSPSSP